MADNRSIIELDRDIFIGAMPKAGAGDNQVTAIMGTLSNSCRHFHRLFQEDLRKKAQRDLWQAVIDDHRQTVARIASAFPHLLLQAAPKNFVIRSQYTHQQFDLSDETLLSVAVKRKQIKMIETLLLCLSAIEQTSDDKKKITDTLSCWSFYDTKKNQKNDEDGENKDSIVHPLEHHHYIPYAQSLLNVCSEEAFKDGTISSNTEQALSLLLNILLPSKPQPLNDCIDIELFLLSIYRILHGNFDKVNGKIHNKIRNLHLGIPDMLIHDIAGYELDQIYNLFFVRIIGLVQSLLSPEMAKMFCVGLHAIYDEPDQTVIDKQPETLRLKEDKPFYRSTPDSRSGMGFDYYAEHSSCDITPAAFPIFEGVLMKKDKLFSDLIQRRSNEWNKDNTRLVAQARPSL